MAGRSQARGSRRELTFSRSDLESVISWSPVASSGSRSFISFDAHCSRLSVRRPLYLERSSAVVPLSMIAPRLEAASAVILKPMAFILRLAMTTSSSTV